MDRQLDFDAEYLDGSDTDFGGAMDTNNTSALYSRISFQASGIPRIMEWKYGIKGRLLFGTVQYSRLLSSTTDPGV